MESAATQALKSTMTSTIRINGREARALFDTGTTGVNLISVNFVETHRLPTKRIDTPLKIMLAAKGSHTSSSATIDFQIEIAPGREVSLTAHITPIHRYDIILGMPFMSEHKAILDVSNSQVRFLKWNYTVSCKGASPKKENNRPATAMVYGSDNGYEPDNLSAGCVTPPELQELENQSSDEERPTGYHDLPGHYYRPVEESSDEEDPTSQATSSHKLPDFKSEFPTVFPDDADKPTLPPLRGPAIDHKIIIDTNKLHTFKARYIPMAATHRPIFSEFIQAWLDAGIAEVGQGHTPSPTFGVPKKDGTVRWVHDFRECNKITISDWTQVPSQRTILHDVAPYTLNGYVSKIDLKNAYHQIRVTEDTEHWNTLYTLNGTYKVRVMLMGDCNATATMTRAMTHVLSNLIGKCCYAYLDDIIVFSTTFEDHMTHLREVFGRLAKFGFYLKLEKCELAQQEVSLLGHRLANGKIHCDPKHLATIRKWPIPTNKKQLQRFLGFINYINSHLPDLSRITAALTELTGNVEWRWDPVHQEAFEQARNLKAIAITPLNYDSIRKE